MMLSGDFSVRAGGAPIVVCVTERLAWEIFLDNCRGAKDVELLRGAVVVAQRGVVQEGERAS